MERGTWTDERLNDRFDQIDRRFDRIDNDLRELRAEIGALRQTMFRVGGAMMGTMTIGFLSVIAAIFARG